jgi:hypothetical protein
MEDSRARSSLPNENKMSDGHRERASLEVKMFGLDFKLSHLQPKPEKSPFLLSL